MSQFLNLDQLICEQCGSEDCSLFRSDGEWLIQCISCDTQWEPDLVEVPLLPANPEEDTHS